MSENKRPLKIFLCHSSLDIFFARRLYLQLINEGANVWFAEETLLPGQTWPSEIPKAIRDSDIVLVCLSKDSVKSDGYVHTEIKLALSVADNMPDGKIFIVPVRLDECEVPDTLKKYHWANYYQDNGYEKLSKSLHSHAEQINASLVTKENGIHLIDLSAPKSRSTFVERRLAKNELDEIEKKKNNKI